MPLGAQELLLIFVLVLLLFGPKRLPELARGLGKGIREFRRATSELQSHLNILGDDDEHEPSSRRPRTARSDQARHEPSHGEPLYAEPFYDEALHDEAAHDDFGREVQHEGGGARAKNQVGPQAGHAPHSDVPTTGVPADDKAPPAPCHDVS